MKVYTEFSLHQKKKVEYASQTWSEFPSSTIAIVTGKDASSVLVRGDRFVTDVHLQCSHKMQPSTK